MKKLFIIIATAILFSCSEVPTGPVDTKDPAPIEENFDFTLGDSVTVDGVEIVFEKAYFLTNDPIYVQTPKRIGVDIRISNKNTASVDYSYLYSWGDMLTNDGEQCSSMISIAVNNASYFDGYRILPGATVTDSMTFEDYAGSPISAKVIGYIPFGDEPDYTLSFNLNELVSKAPTE